MNVARLALSVAVVLAIPLAGCGKQEAPATKDEPVKHEKHEAVRPESAHAAPVEVPAHAAAPANPFPTVDAAGLAADGLPSVIPPPGSAPPSVAEWNAVPKEIDVKGSTAHNCETKMLREWLRVSCHPKAPFTPSGVSTKQSAGQQVFAGKFGDITSVVVQVVHGKDYSAEYAWSEAGRSSSANLFVHWPSNQPRPSIYFDR